MSDLAYLVGEDTYHHVVDVNYLHDGDRFRAERSIVTVSGGTKKEVVYGTAAMRGLFHIKVRLDHRPEDYHQPHSLLANESIYPDRDGWVFYSTRQVLDAENKAKNEAKRKTEIEAHEKLIAEADAQIRQHERSIEALLRKKGDSTHALALLQIN